MNKKLVIGLSVVVVVLGGLTVMSLRSPAVPGTTAQYQNNQNTPITNMTSVPTSTVEKIEVVHFHATQQCWSCITVGEYALKTIKEKFPEEYKNGTIVYKDINGELPGNKDIVLKYQARGSSLYVNTILSGEDHIEEDVNVWRLVSNEQQFISYFETKLKNLLGK
jgi:hypothetical protein